MNEPLPFPNAVQRNDRFAVGEFQVDHDVDARRHGKGVKYEGEGGVFSQTWFPICRSTDLAAGEVIGTPFLNGHVVAFRGEDGVASVVSAYCPHNGANLKTGRVLGNHLQCAFHHWCFDGSGKCARTGSGDKVPPGGNLFKYPTRERFGLVWAFNGEEASWELPDLGFPDDELVFHPTIETLDLLADPWCFMCNTLDFNHIRCVHGIDLDQEDPLQDIEWGDYSVLYPLKGKFRETGVPIEYNLGILGTNIFWQTGYIKDRWFGFLFPCGIHRPGTQRCYFILASKKSDGELSDKETAEFLQFVYDLEKEVVGQDVDILNSIRYTRGYFTKSDRALSKFINHINAFPRAHPGAEFIR